jgi:hypothetical protein
MHVPLSLLLASSSFAHLSHPSFLASFLLSSKVIIIKHKPLWISKIQQVVDNGSAAKNLNFSPLYGSARALISTYLRIDIPILGFLDEYVLYTDGDVLFVREVKLEDFIIKRETKRKNKSSTSSVSFSSSLPKYIFMSLENKVASKDEFNHANAGVMLYNLKGTRRTYEKFLAHVFSSQYMEAGLHYGEHGPGDQGAYQSFYKKATEQHVNNGVCGSTSSCAIDKVLLSPLNWRPYWPEKLQHAPPAIVHFHGPKPKDYMKLRDVGEGADGRFRELFRGCDRNDSMNSCWKWAEAWEAMHVFIDSTF